MDKEEQVKKNTLELKAWVEWKEICELERCSKDSKCTLNAYADRSLEYSISTITFSMLKKEEFFPGCSFGLFEMHALNKTFTSRKEELEGKSYKDGIFYDMLKSEDPPLKVIRGKFQKYLQGSIRELYGVTKHKAKKLQQQQSLDENLGMKEGFTAYDLLVSEPVESSIDVVDFQILVDIAQEIFKQMSFNHRVITYARIKEYPMTNSKQFLEILGMSKSTVSDHCRYIFVRKDYLSAVDEVVEVDYHEKVELYRHSFLQLEKIISSWITSDMKAKKILTIINNYLNEKGK